MAKIAAPDSEITSMATSLRDALTPATPPEAPASPHAREMTAREIPVTANNGKAYAIRERTDILKSKTPGGAPTIVGHGFATRDVHTRDLADRTRGPLRPLGRPMRGKR